MLVEREKIIYNLTTIFFKLRLQTKKTRQLLFVLIRV